MKEFTKIEKYEIVEKIGEGSFGVVYKGRDPHLKREVAIKICSVEDSGLRQRFMREAEISGKLRHRNIVTVFAFGFQDDYPYLAQELLPGEDLDALIRRSGRPSSLSALSHLLQIAEGLSYAHGEGVVHRDIKPANIRVLEDGQVKIMDFGIAKLASAETQLTQHGVTMGTANYLPPEQVRGGAVDHRADIFSFGVLAYELLANERPFRGKTLSALVYQILYKVPLPLTAVWNDCPSELSDLVGKCLEKKPERRFASFADLVPLLQKLLDGVESGRWPGLSASGPRSTSSIAKMSSGGTVSGEATSGDAVSAAGRAADDPSDDIGADDPSDDIGNDTRLGLATPGAETRQEEAALNIGQPGVDLGSTQAVDPVHLEELAESFRIQSATTAAAKAGGTTPMGPMDRPWAGAEDGGSGDPHLESNAVLADRGQAIGQLVAKGKLQEALQHLEETYTQAKDGTLTSGFDPVEANAVSGENPALGASADSAGGPNEEGAGGGAGLHATVQIPASSLLPPDLPTVRLRDPEPSAVTSQDPASQDTAATNTAATNTAATNTAATNTAATNTAATNTAATNTAKKEAASAKPKTKSGARKKPQVPRQGRTASSGRRPLYAGLGLLVIVAAILLWPKSGEEPDLASGQGSGTGSSMARSSGGGARLAESSINIGPGKRPLDLGQGRTLGLIEVSAMPWAELLSVQDAAGQDLALPVERHTPLLLQLPPGTYTLTLSHPSIGAPHLCTAVVDLQAVASCDFAVRQPDLIQFFKESEWWK